ncbi:MAG: VTT domain-containing protein [Chloroflexi bacterium]|nr:VTT domain-containing protein [Chloroflexota bacterium]
MVVTGALVLLRGELRDFQSYGYLGAFVISLLSSATIIVPVPGLAVVFALGGLLNPFFVGIASGAGEPFGELTGYMAGRGGHVAFKIRNGHRYEKIEGWMRRRGMLLVFLTSSFPNPVFDLIGAAAGAIKMPLWKFILACWAGKTIKGVGIALAGYFGLRFFLNLFGVSL